MAKNLASFINSFLDNNENPEAPLPKETLPLENDLEQLESQMREVSTNQEQLNKNFLELTELKHVLRKTQSFFEEAQTFAASAPGVQVDVETGEEERIRLLNRVNAKELLLLTHILIHICYPIKFLIVGKFDQNFFKSIFFRIDFFANLKTAKFLSLDF